MTRACSAVMRVCLLDMPHARRTCAALLCCWRLTCLLCRAACEVCVTYCKYLSFPTALQAALYANTIYIADRGPDIQSEVPDFFGNGFYLPTVYWAALTPSFCVSGPCAPWFGSDWGWSDGWNWVTGGDSCCLPVLWHLLCFVVALVGPNELLLVCLEAIGTEVDGWDGVTGTCIQFGGFFPYLPSVLCFDLCHATPPFRPKMSGPCVP